MTITTIYYNRVLSTDNGPESISMTNAVPQMGDETSATVTHASEENAAEDSQQTTTFTNDGIVVESAQRSWMRLPSLFTMSSDSHNSEDIKSFLAKPQKIWSGVLSTSDVSTTVNFNQQNPSIFTAQPIFTGKLSGFLGIRATTCLRWVVNGTPFHQGRYMLYYVPVGGMQYNTKTSLWVDAHRNTLYERTQLHRIELDVTCDTEGIIKIPYSSVLNYYPLKNINAFNFLGNLGIFFIQPYEPLATLGGSSTIGSTLYAYLEDVELVGAAVPQMGGKREISSTEKEAKAAGVGPVSSTILSFSKAANALAEVPFLSTFASTTGWALEVLGKGAKAAGFSKPQNYTTSTRMNIIPGVFMGNVDGFDQSITLGASSENVVPVLPGFAGTDIDEMSIPHIVSIPAYFKRVSWGSETSDTQLAQWNLRPNAFQQVRTFGSIPVYNHTPVSFIGNMFQCWRGSFVFKIKFVKTIFHSGRLAICFNPFDPKVAPVPVSAGTSAYLHREIVDIRTCNELEFTVPYVNLSPWLESSESFGEIVIFVIDALAAPSNVPSSITMFFEVCGGPDLEFSIPANGLHTDALGCTGMPALGITAQIGSDPCDLMSTNIGSTSLPPESVMNSEFCIGEKIVSLRALGKIFRPQRLSAVLASNFIESVAPFSTQFAYWNGTAFTSQTLLGDFLDHISLCFLYSRGSVRYKKYTPGSSSACMAWLGYNNAPTDIFSRGTSDLAGKGVNAVALSAGKYGVFSMSFVNNGMMEVTVPQYSKRHSRNTIAEAHNGSVGLVVSSPGGLGSGMILNTGVSYFGGDYATNGNIVLAVNFRAMGDDFCLGGFVSTIPLTYNYASGNL